jgi:hypothetical protein
MSIFNHRRRKIACKELTFSRGRVGDRLGHARQHGVGQHVVHGRRLPFHHHLRIACSHQPHRIEHERAVGGRGSSSSSSSSGMGIGDFRDVVEHVTEEIDDQGELAGIAHSDLC